MAEKILLVDDDQMTLSMYERTFGNEFSIDTACGGPEALDKIAISEAYAVVLSDLRMPGMDGLELLRRVHQITPDTILLILSGNADLRTAISAVNEGSLFRFLEKPCPSESIAAILLAALKQYSLVVSEKDILERTLHGSIKVLTEVLELANPEAASMASRITVYVKHLVSVFQLSDGWQFEVAAMLSQLGSIVVSPEPVGGRHSRVAFELLRKIPRLEIIAGMVGRQQERFCDQPRFPISGTDQETLGAQMLKICVAFDALVRSRQTLTRAVDALLGQPDEYRPEMVVRLRDCLVAIPAYQARVLDIKDLMLHMMLDKDVVTKDGTLVVRKGVEVTEPLLARLRSFHSRGTIPAMIQVLAPVHGQIATSTISN